MLNSELAHAGSATLPPGDAAHLPERKPVATPAVLLAPLAWGLPTAPAGVQALVELADRPPKPRLSKSLSRAQDLLGGWLADSTDDPVAALAVAAVLAFEAVAANADQGLVRRAAPHGLLTAGPKQSLQRLISVVPLAIRVPAIARLLHLVKHSGAGGDPLPLLPRLWLTAELPLRLAALDDEKCDGQSLSARGVAGLTAFVTQALDDEGWPGEGGWETLPAVLASLLRCQQLLEALSPASIPDLFRLRAGQLLQNCWRAATADGVYDPQRPAAEQRALLTAAGDQFASAAVKRSAELALSKRRTTGDPPTAVPASGASEAAGVAVLRSRWSSPADLLLVDHSQPELRLELAVGGKRLFSGVWGFSVLVNGVPLATDSTDEPGWRQVCWHTDADCDYLELEYPFAGGWRLQRQAFLIRRDRALLLADALLGPASSAAAASPPPRLRYQGRLPLASGVSFAPAPESREGDLKVKRAHAALVLPLAMPEWRTLLAGGELVQHEAGLHYTLDAGGRNLYAPLWIDLDPARGRKQHTWRRLTVGEQLQAAPRDLAAGFRVQVHKQQWLLYRSLGGWGNRTVLGKNFATDFACCRFLPNGETEDILEIE